VGSGSTRGDESDSSGAMSKTFRPWDVEQRWLLPPSVHELVPVRHVAHFVRDTVREELDLSAIFAAYDEERGYPPYHPTMMVALLLYAYSRGLYSSGRIAQACEERLDFMAVTAMNQPDFRTIAKFRRRHLKALSDLSVQVLKLCQAAGLVKLGHVALDGSKIAANASVHKACGRPRRILPPRSPPGCLRPRRPMWRRIVPSEAINAAMRCPTGLPTKQHGSSASAPPKPSSKLKPISRRPTMRTDRGRPPA
jgi:transposase